MICIGCVPILKRHVGGASKYFTSFIGAGGTFRGVSGIFFPDTDAETSWRSPHPPPEGTGTWPDYLVNRDDQKKEGPFGGKNCTEIEK